MNLELINTLRQMAETQDLKHRAEQTCRQWLAKECTEEQRGELQLVFRRCALVFEHRILPEVFLETAFDICVVFSTNLHIAGMEKIGSYRLITDLDGRALDDYFELDPRAQLERNSPGESHGPLE